MISSGVNLVMTVIGFAVSTMFIVFVCTRLICARIQLNASRRSLLVASRSNLSMLERGSQGLESKAVANFPTKKYSDGCILLLQNILICLSEYQGEDVLRILPCCGHFFHATCIDVWLQQHSTCPLKDMERFALENVTNLSDADQSMKDAGKKHLESPSITPLS
ncbi:hypothetical protein K1719_047568 [Acacia pycnantha]|nr:hypothetical protein K1719_047568 [Acacia pycnantha]